MRGLDGDILMVFCGWRVLEGICPRNTCIRRPAVESRTIHHQGHRIDKTHSEMHGWAYCQDPGRATLRASRAAVNRGATR